MTKTDTRVLYWHRTDLRLHDSPALAAALALNPSALYPVWCWDSHYVYRARVGPNRWNFLLECMADLSASYSKLNSASKLLVLREPAVTLLPKLWRQWGITHCVFEGDEGDAYGRERDAVVVEAAREAGVEVLVKSGRTLWDSAAVVKANGGKPPMSMAALRAAAAKVGDVPEPVDAPTWVPAPGELGLEGLEQSVPTGTPDVNGKFRVGAEGSYDEGVAGPGGDFAVPTMEELGMGGAVTTQHKGGETVALANLEQILADEEYTGTFEKPTTSPAAFEPQSTCLTSPYLHFGALSVRLFYHRVEAILAKRRKARQPISEPPTSLQGQLIFRDMYFAAQAALGWSFGQTYNNSHCRFVPWHLPSKIDVSTRLATGDFEIDSEEKAAWLHRWAHGLTGFPWIDAIMRQLRQEGWIHHLARHSVACFLTRGGCYISWERGAAVFEELLIDHETACNAGNWQWLSCTAFYAQFYRCYSPVAFGKKWDPEGAFIRKYVPELAGVEKKFIYEPHKAPIADQKKAGVLVKGDGEETERDGVKVYPKPIFDFNVQRDICLAGMKNAYKVGLYGNSPAVLDGTWKKAFGDAAEGPTDGKEGGPGGLVSWEDANGTEEAAEGIMPVQMEMGGAKAGAGSPAKGGMAAKSARGHKREHSQGALDGAFKKKVK